MIRKMAFAIVLALTCAPAASARDYCVGDRVVTESHLRGTIVAAYPDSTVDIAFDIGSTNNWPTDRIYPIPTSINGFYVDERIVTENHLFGKIVSAYPDGTVDIAFDIGSTNNWPTSQIFPVQTSVGGYLLNERVVTDNHLFGTVVACYPDDTVDIRFDIGSTNNWPISRISRAQDCTGSGGRCR